MPTVSPTAVLLLPLALLLVGLFWLLSRRLYLRRLRRMAARWADRAPNPPEEEDLPDIAEYWRQRSARHPDRVPVDDITWSDLDMDTLFRAMNYTDTGAGAEVLYALLRDTGATDADLARRQRWIRAMRTNAEARTRLRAALLPQGHGHVYGAIAYLYATESKHPRFAWGYGLLAAGTVLAVVGCFFHPAFVVALTGLMLGNFAVHFLGSRAWSSQIGAVRHLSAVIASACRLETLLPQELDDARQELHGLCAALKPVLRLNAIFARERTGDLTDLLMDYLRIMLHSDMLCLCRITRLFEQRGDALRRIYALVGEIDACISLAAWADHRETLCAPDFSPETAVNLRGLVHPLLSSPVPNDLDWQGGVLITGSNASGKSTFTRAVAMNAILAQTICLCCAESLRLPRCRVMTSMALRDSLLRGESYFMVELRSLKRMLDAADDLPTLCFIDEILRGTGTVERIASSTALLGCLRKRGVLCMAATHDHELTRLLPEYAQYHFRETLTESGMTFAYRLLPGPADTRNAIALMDRMDFPPQLVSQARASAAHFDESGHWLIPDPSAKENP